MDGPGDGEYLDYSQMFGDMLLDNGEYAEMPMDGDFIDPEYMEEYMDGYYGDEMDLYQQYQEYLAQEEQNMYVR